MKFDKLKALLLLGLIIPGIVVVLSNKPDRQVDQSSETPAPKSAGQVNKTPQIVSTKPDLTGGEIIVSATEIIEVTFNIPLENIGEFKHKFEPKSEIKIELSSDRKTIRIIPQKPYELGAEYTILIYPDSKFDGGLRLDGEKIFHFKTIRYRGV